MWFCETRGREGGDEDGLNAVDRVSRRARLCGWRVLQESAAMG